MASDLLTLAEYLQATGQKQADVDQTAQDQISWAITAASDAVRSYVDRDFTLQDDADQSPKTYRYLGDHGLEIDDAQEVNSVSVVSNQFTSGRTLDTSEWFASAVENPDGILDSLELYTLLPWSGSGSPEMGFARNLDTIGYVPYPVLLSVDALWGWPAIPAKVKQATMLAVVSDVDNQEPYNAESISSYSRSYTSSRSGAIRPVNALPDRALALLDAYLRWPI